MINYSQLVGIDQSGCENPLLPKSFKHNDLKNNMLASVLCGQDAGLISFVASVME